MAPENPRKSLKSQENLKKTKRKGLIYTHKMLPKTVGKRNSKEK
jgi:hypothetical protein